MSEPRGPFGFRPPKRDPEQQAAARRTQEQYLRDIGDEEGLNRLENPPRRRRPRLWVFLVVILVVIVTGYKAFTSNGTVPIDKSCTVGRLALTSSKAATGASVPWSATGPNDSIWALAIGGGQVTRSGNTVRVAGGRAGSGAFSMKGCLAHGGLQAPKTTGDYDVRLIRFDGTGAQEVAKVRLTVVK